MHAQPIQTLKLKTNRFGLDLLVIIYWTAHQALKPVFYPIIKRTLDILASFLGLIVLSPLFLVLSLLIPATSKGPVFFKQQRVGLNGKAFNMWKFRSMRQDSDDLKQKLQGLNESQDGVTFKIKSDPRVTSIGRWIRKFSVDELPQLFNVLLGQMSLVGPRPPVPKEVLQYSLLQRERLSIQPGITCLWQVSGRSDIPFNEQVKLDRTYIFQRSIWFDFKLLVKTIPAVLSARGAY